jgi:ribonuclease Z
LPGELLVAELKKIGIEPGPIYKCLKEGRKITLKDGRIIDGKNFLGQSKAGRKIAIAGDTRMTNKSNLLAEGMDVLVHEATFSKDEARHAYDYFHSTSTQVANVAQSEQIKMLILTHISARYQGEDTDMLLQQAKEIFSNTQIAKDYDRFPIPRY